MRITKTGHKVLYIIGFLAGNTGINLGARFINPTDHVAFVLWNLLSAGWAIAAVLIAARTFRGDNEFPGSERPWWRWTARPRAGWWLAAYFCFPLVIVVVSLVSESLRFPTLWLVLWYRWVGALVIAALVAGYLNSSIQLHRRPELIPPRVLPTQEDATLQAARVQADRQPEGW